MPRISSPRSPAGMSSDAFLNAAAAIGRRIVTDAVWHEGRCSWIGAVTEPTDRGRPEYRAVGPLVYGGTAGIGLFLAHLAAATGEASIGRTARGAIRHAVAFAPGESDGLQAGTLGIAWAAARAAALLGEGELETGARAVQGHARPAHGHGRCPDLVQGAAGTIVARLALAVELGEPGLIGQATEIGETLLDDASITRRGWSWADSTRPRRRHLCGAAHGASGIASALLELFAVTGDERFRDGATGAFDYERSWLDRHSGSWPDLRHGYAATGMTGTWCYGEAGIAVSRLRAIEVLDDGPHRLDADISVETTRRHLAAQLPYAFDDLSLCHGLGGAAAALLAAGDRRAAAELGEVALDRYGPGRDWPCGVYGTTPNLFRGLSGIGWLFLCLHDARIPSPLAVPAGGLTAMSAEQYVRPNP